MKTKFTKGPWTADIGLTDGGSGIAGKNGVVLADVYDLNQKGKANAHLIASAPEMYAALVRAKAAFLNRQFEKGMPFDEDVMRVIEQALAKARGES